MIVAKILLSTGFSGLVGYALSSSKQIKSEQINTRNIFDLARTADEMELIAARSSRVKDPVAHFVVSWSKDESVDVARQLQAGHQILAALKLSDHQALIVVHDEPKGGIRPGPNGRHYEMHMIVNRVHPSGTVNNMSHSFARAEVAAKQISERLGFSVVPGRFNGAILDKPGVGQSIGSIRAETGRPTIAEELLTNSASMARLREARRRGWPELLAAFAELGVQIAPPPANTAAARGRAKRNLQRGLVMIDATETDRRIKISALDTAYEKWGAIALERDLGPVPYAMLPVPAKQAKDKSKDARQEVSTVSSAIPALDAAPYRMFMLEKSRASKERKEQIESGKRRRSEIYLGAKVEFEALISKADTRRKLVRMFCGRRSLVGAALNAILDTTLALRLGEIRKHRDIAIAELNSDLTRDRIAVPRWSDWRRRNMLDDKLVKPIGSSIHSISRTSTTRDPAPSQALFGAPSRFSGHATRDPWPVPRLSKPLSFSALPVSSAPLRSNPSHGKSLFGAPSGQSGNQRGRTTYPSRFPAGKTR